MIHIDHLTVRLGDRDVLKDISFDGSRGDYIAVLGPNGGGKSTLLKTILGLHSPREGSISFDRSSIRADSPSVGYVPQTKALDRTFPARAIELVVTSLRGRWPAVLSSAERALAMSALEQVGAPHLATRSVSSLSGGELQRAYLARAIITKPDLLLLDEPESGVDFVGTKDLYTLLESYHRETTSCIIMVTHDLDVAYHHASHVLLVNGKCYGFGSATDALTEEAVRNTFGHVGHKHSMLAGLGTATNEHRHA